MIVVKLGDYVWLGRYNNQKQRMAQVIRLTQTQIILEPYEDRYNRDTGLRIGGGGALSNITGLATPEEVKTYKAEQERKRQEMESRQNIAKAYDAKKAELSNLFGDEQVWIQTADSGNVERFQLVIDELTEEQARYLANMLNKHAWRNPPAARKH